MSPAEYLAKAEPKHLAEVRWFDAELRPYYIRERRAVFYLQRVEWADHPWGRERQGGDAFEDVWTLESRSVWPSKEYRFRADGRSGDGWGALLKGGYAVYATESAALEFLAVKLKERIVSEENALTEVRGMLESVECRLALPGVELVPGGTP